MAITYVGGATGSAVDGADTSAIALPTLQENDIVLVAGGHTGAASQTPGPTDSGYAEIASVALVGNKYFTVHRKRMGATPDTTVTGGGSGNANHGCSYVVMCFRGVDTTTSEDATATVAQASSTNPDSPSITTVTNGAAVVSLAGSIVSDSSVTVPTGYGDKVNISTSGETQDYSAAGAWITKATAGAENPAAWASWASGIWGAATVALRPAAVPVTHATTGALTGPGSTVAGSAARTRQHATTGVLAGPGASIAGDAERTAAAVTHETTGELIGPGSAISGAAELDAVAPPSVVGAVSTVGGPGWDLFHPVSKRRRRVEDVEQDLRSAYARANNEEDPYAQKEAVRELKQAAATAKAIAKRENAQDLFDLASQIIAMRKLRDMQEYLERVGEILRKEAAEEDDMEAFMTIARLA